MEQWSKRLLWGAIAGALATVPHSLVMAAGRRARLLYNPPPKHIIERATEKTRTRHNLPPPVFQAGWVAAHVGYGAVAGGLYALLGPLLPGRIAERGLLFGILVWAVSYFGLLPSLGLYPSPRDDSKSQQIVLILAHAAYGVATAEIASRFGARVQSADAGHIPHSERAQESALR
jgi:uncharacterized membrane protein YagU involved in acid resistance